MENIILILKNNITPIITAMSSLLGAIIYLKRSLLQTKNDFAELKTQTKIDIERIQSQLTVHNNALNQHSTALARLEDMSKLLLEIVQKLAVIEEKMTHFEITKRR